MEQIPSIAGLSERGASSVFFMAAIGTVAAFCVVCVSNCGGHLSNEDGLLSTPIFCLSFVCIAVACLAQLDTALLCFAEPFRQL